MNHAQGGVTETRYQICGSFKEALGHTRPLSLNMVGYVSITIDVKPSQEINVDYQRYIVRDPQICGGEPVIKGTRVTLRTILASLAEGASVQEIIEDFPTLKEEDVRAAIAFAAASAEEDLPVPSIPTIP
jgi:uncharacterized protein (DUF433 family)